MLPFFVRPFLATACNANLSPHSRALGLAGCAGHALALNLLSLGGAGATGFGLGLVDLAACGLGFSFSHFATALGGAGA